MREQITPEEEAFLQATLEFANLKKIRSTRQVEDLFRRAPLVAPVFKVIPRRYLAAYYRDQAELRLWLDQIAEQGDFARSKIGPDVSRRLGTVDVRLAYDPTRERVIAQWALTGVQACYAYATALLLDRSRGLTRRLGKCGWRQCQRYNLTLRGKPRKHCNEDHRRRADAQKAKERMRRYRQKMKQRALREEGRP
jgi:hypothetical protein